MDYVILMHNDTIQPYGITLSLTLTLIALKNPNTILIHNDDT